MKISPVAEYAGELNKSALEQRKPIVFRNQNIGSCLEKWASPDYLARNLAGLPMSVHVAGPEVSQLNFIEKNFSYQTLNGEEMVKRIFEKEHENFFFHKNEQYYLRSLGANIRKDVSDLRHQFEFTAKDINWPLFESIFGELYQSSILRFASASLRIWTHYDVYDNFLFQIVGERFLTLYAPKYADCAYLKADKSAVVDPYDYDVAKFPKFAQIEQYTVTLRPGDVLFIPALWFHHISMGPTAGVGVNVFWKGPLQPSQYSPSDLYGNKDPIPAEQAIAMASKVVKLLEQMQPDHADFYAKRVCQKILDGIKQEQ